MNKAFVYTGSAQNQMPLLTELNALCLIEAIKISLLRSWIATSRKERVAEISPLLFPEGVSQFRDHSLLRLIGSSHKPIIKSGATFTISALPDRWRDGSSSSGRNHLHSCVSLLESVDPTLGGAAARLWSGAPLRIQRST